MKRSVCILPFVQLFVLSGNVWADYKTDIGFDKLQSELGLNRPNGNGVKVAEVEASAVKESDPSFPVFAPRPDVNTMLGKTFAYPGLNCNAQPCPPNDYSAHALGVANVFFGNSVSMASGINDIHSYEVNQWLNTLFVHGVNDTALQATITDRRIANHSWVGRGDTLEESGTILRVVDRQVNLNEYIQVNATGSTLLGNAYNTISVGLSSASTGSSSADIDAVYRANRAITDIVAPAANLSTATPIVSAATALLIETGHRQGSALSDGFITIADAGTVFNAERSETIKAILMAGADRSTTNSTGSDISDYGNNDHKTANGLDDRYGAGQVNIYNSYRIITAGEQSSFEDSGENDSIGLVGFDYDPEFGGARGSNYTASYAFSATADETLSAALVWNAEISDDSLLNTSFHHLELSLLDVTDNAFVARSASMVDNTQNIYFPGLVAGHDYQIQVALLDTGTLNMDYSLAWHRSINTTPVPLPAAFWLFGSALVGLIGHQRKPRLRSDC